MSERLNISYPLFTLDQAWAFGPIRMFLDCSVNLFFGNFIFSTRYQRLKTNPQGIKYIVIVHLNFNVCQCTEIVFV